MLTRLYVDNYKCLVNFEFRPSAKQLVIGRNGAGKSTVFDVLSLLRDFAVRGESCDGRLAGATRTRWQDVPKQRFEITVQRDDAEYKYVLVVDEEHSTPPRPRVVQETLEFGGKPLLRFEKGQITLSDGSQPFRRKGSLGFLLRNRSALAITDTSQDEALAWFKQWLGRLVHVQINPWAMSARSEREAREPSKDLGNFADWYRHLRLDSGSAAFEALAGLRDAFPGLEALDVKEAGLDVRVVQATVRGVSGKLAHFPLDDLSEGQRVLIALYVLLYCAVIPDTTVCIDEPDNFIALAEIQPWLMKLLDRVDQHNAQIILLSHHPELLNQMAGQGGLLLDRPAGGPTRVAPFQPSDDSGLTPAELIARGWENA